MGANPERVQGRCRRWRIRSSWSGAGGVHVSPLNSFFSSLLGHSTHLSEFEKLILQSVRSQLTGNIGVLWDGQVQAINKVQRLPDGVEVNFYRMRGRRPTFDAQLAFPNRTEELLVARVQIGVAKITSSVIARVWCVKGFLFSLEYEGSIKYFEEAAGMDPKPEFIVTCELTADLSLPSG